MKPAKWAALASFLLSHVDLWLLPLVLTCAWFYYPYCQRGPTLCLSRLLFHVNCPGCGLTRGVCFLVHGRWREALRFNLLSPVVLALMAITFKAEAVSMLQSGRHRPLV